MKKKKLIIWKRCTWIQYSYRKTQSQQRKIWNLWKVWWTFIFFITRVVVCTRFLEKFASWSWTWVDVVFLLIWYNVVRYLEFDHLILSRLNVYTWFWESEACDVLEVGWTPTLDLGKWNMWCSWSLSLGSKFISL